MSAKKVASAIDITNIRIANLLNFRFLNQVEALDMADRLNCF